LDQIDYEIVDAAAFEELAETKRPTQAGAAWEPILHALADGLYVRIPVSNDRDRKGKRLTLARRARDRGFSVEMRYADDSIVAHKNAEVAEEEKVGKLRRRRPRA
jgi:hypothetical protein